MDSAGEDLDNIFEDHENRENEGEANGMGNNEESNNETSAGVRIQPTKRVVKNPRLKFNPERLCGQRGIPVLMDHFKNVKFKGKGHETEDLDKLLSRLEHWTHRLFPSMKFEDCIHHIEKLGKKRPVQTCLRKIRLNMPILSQDFVNDEEDNIRRNEDSEPEEIDAFDRLIGESQNFNPVTSVESVMNSDTLPNFSSPAQIEPASESRGQVLGTYGSSLTEEQKERLERNRLLAIERRKARSAAALQGTAEPSLASNETLSTQKDPIAHSFDSLTKDKGNKSNGLFVNNSHSHHNEDGESISLNNPDSDNLELEDLIDLVDEDEHASDKNMTALSSEQTEMVCLKQCEVFGADEHSQKSGVEIKNSNAEQSVSCSTSDYSTANVPEKTLESTEDKNLDLESSMDFVNDN